METWDGEWLGLVPIYTGLTSSGEGLKVGSGLKDRLNYQEQQIARLNDSVQRVPALMLSHMVNEADGAPSTAPTQNTRYEMMVQYDYASETMSWHLQEHNSPVTYTAGTHTITNGYELILCDTSGGAVTIDLPDPTLSKGKKYYFKKTTASHQVIITGGGYDIDGSPSKVMTSQFETCTVISDGAQWWLI
jgi:hypothetical protein